MTHGLQQSNSLVVGVGNEQRGDDAAGLLVVRALRRAGIQCADLVEHPGDGAGLMELWQGYSRVIVVDALDGALETDVAWFDVSSSRAGFVTTASSTHAIGLSQAVEMARALGLLPRRIEICAIAAHEFAPFSTPSADVERACARAAEQISARLGQSIESEGRGQTTCTR